MVSFDLSENGSALIKIIAKIIAFSSSHIFCLFVLLRKCIHHLELGTGKNKKEAFEESITKEKQKKALPTFVPY